LAICLAHFLQTTNAEWTALFNYLKDNGYNYDGSTTGDYKSAKSLASSSGWNSSSTVGVVGNADYPDKRNATGFTAVPGGTRYNDHFASVSYSSWWWTATVWDVGSTSAYEVMEFQYPGVYTGGNYLTRGQAVRCVKNQMIT
jgi:uncharacterized protein (TIGR02145 family)